MADTLTYLLYLLFPCYRYYLLEVQESASINNFLVVLKVAVVLVFIILGWNFIDTTYTPYIPENTGVLEVWMVRVAAGAGVLAFIGFDLYQPLHRS
jgi:amino acid transporter